MTSFSSLEIIKPNLDRLRIEFMLSYASKYSVWKKKKRFEEITNQPEYYFVKLKRVVWLVSQGVKLFQLFFFFLLFDE